MTYRRIDRPNGGRLIDVVEDDGIYGDGWPYVGMAETEQMSASTRAAMRLIGIIVAVAIILWLR